MRRSAFFPVAGLFAWFSVAGSVAALAQSGDFDISQNGKPVGSAGYTFTASHSGFDSTSLVHVSMKGLDYALSKTERLTPDNRLKRVQLSATINASAVHVVAAPDEAQLLLNISANGRGSTTRLDAHPSAVFLPDFDPGALETLLATAVIQSNRDLWAIIPKGTGAVESIQLATYPDEQGTLDGQPIAVHHLIATIAGAVTDLFSGPDNQLLQAELPQPGFALVRKGFVLTPPARPDALPQQ